MRKGCGEVAPLVEAGRGGARSCDIVHAFQASARHTEFLFCSSLARELTRVHIPLPVYRVQKRKKRGKEKKGWRVGIKLWMREPQGQGLQRRGEKMDLWPFVVLCSLDHIQHAPSGSFPLLNAPAFDLKGSQSAFKTEPRHHLLPDLPPNCPTNPV